MIREAPGESSKEEPIALVAAPLAENAAPKPRMAELERRLGLNGTNSGKPPSSDGLPKPARARSLRQRSSRQPGGQKGRKGETLRQAAEPGQAADRYPSACSGCGAAPTPDMAQDMAEDYTARQAFDLPEPQPLAAAGHRAHGTSRA